MTTNNPNSSLNTPHSPETTKEVPPVLQELRSSLKKSLENWEALSQFEGRLAPDEKMLSEIRSLLDRINQQMQGF